MEGDGLTIIKGMDLGNVEHEPFLHLRLLHGRMNYKDTEPLMSAFL
jgi:hypothetical protein